MAFRSNSDTEVILRLYEADGPAFVERLRGMFAFAIWDEQERTCLLARDRFGIKPLYYHEAGGVLTFASEVRALVASGVPADASMRRRRIEYFRIRLGAGAADADPGRARARGRPLHDVAGRPG